MMFSGLSTVRPGHDAHSLSVLDACRARNSATVVHVRTSRESGVRGKR